MKLNCIIVDDEPLAIRILEKHIAKIQDMEIIGRCEDAVEAFSLLQRNKVNLMFLDIQMPELTGLDLMKTITNPPLVIITTAYREYALEGYELDVVDYLLKPISFERFLKAIQKVYRKTEPELVLHQKVIDTSNRTGDEFLLVKVKKKLVKVMLKEILYIENLGDYLRIKTTDKEVVTKILISEMERTLPESEFIRIHRSFIIHLSRIESFSPTTVEINNIEIPIGRSYKTVVLKRLDYDKR